MSERHFPQFQQQHKLDIYACFNRCHTNTTAPTPLTHRPIGVICASSVFDKITISIVYVCVCVCECAIAYGVYQPSRKQEMPQTDKPILSGICYLFIHIRSEPHTAHTHTYRTQSHNVYIWRDSGDIGVRKCLTPFNYSQWLNSLSHTQLLSVS